MPEKLQNGQMMRKGQEKEPEKEQHKEKEEKIKTPKTKQLNMALSFLLYLNDIRNRKFYVDNLILLPRLYEGQYNTENLERGSIIITMGHMMQTINEYNKNLLEFFNYLKSEQGREYFKTIGFTDKEIKILESVLSKALKELVAFKYRIPKLADLDREQLIKIEQDFKYVVNRAFISIFMAVKKPIEREIDSELGKFARQRQIASFILSYTSKLGFESSPLYDSLFMLHLLYNFTNTKPEKNMYMLSSFIPQQLMPFLSGYIPGSGVGNLLTKAVSGLETRFSDYLFAFLDLISMAKLKRVPHLPNDDHIPIVERVVGKGGDLRHVEARTGLIGRALADEKKEKEYEELYEKIRTFYFKEGFESNYKRFRELLLDPKYRQAFYIDMETLMAFGFSEQTARLLTMFRYMYELESGFGHTNRVAELYRRVKGMLSKNEEAALLCHDIGKCFIPKDAHHGRHALTHDLKTNELKREMAPLITEAHVIFNYYLTEMLKKYVPEADRKILESEEWIGILFGHHPNYVNKYTRSISNIDPRIVLCDTFDAIFSYRPYRKDDKEIWEKIFDFLSIAKDMKGISSEKAQEYVFKIFRIAFDMAGIKLTKEELKMLRNFIKEAIRADKDRIEEAARKNKVYDLFIQFEEGYRKLIYYQ
ncbi:MAG: hypothetical protein QXS91_02710 [Candidatus Anstonellales archaeon]